MKVYPKSDLHLKDGLLVTSEGDVVCIDPDIVDLANELETKLQKARFLAKQPEAQPMPSLEGFVRKSVNKIEMFTTETPLADKQAEDALAFMNELDDVKLTNDMNQMLNGMFDLVMFVREDSVLGMEAASIHRFDTPELGNPLTWNEDTLATAVAEIHGCKVTDYTKDGDESNVESE